MPRLNSMFSYIGGFMTNIKMLEQVLPTAPLKIAAHKSCETLGKKVNDILSDSQGILKKYVDSALFCIL